MLKSMGSAAVAQPIGGAATIESVADILESEHQHLIEDWLARVEKEPDLTCIPLNFEERTGHLPQFMRDVVARLRLDAGTKAPISEAAGHHGDLRRKQGYTVAMAVEESRLLQATIFSTLHKNVNSLEFSALLPDVVTVADAPIGSCGVSVVLYSETEMPLFRVPKAFEDILVWSHQLDDRQ